VRNAVCFFFGCVCVLLALSSKLIRDPDTHWHIAVGRWIWQQRSVPWTDAFSHTFAGAPWIAKEWLSQLLFFGAFSAGGWQGVVVLTAVAVAGAFALLFVLMQQRLEPTKAFIVTLVAVLLSTPQLHARPQVFTFVVLLAWTAALSRAAERKAGPPWPALAILALWANLHGSFTIGFAIAGIFAVDAVVAAPREKRSTVAASWAAFLCAAVAAGCVSPYGYHAMLVTVTLFGTGESRRYISEWQPLSFDFIGVLAIATLLLAVYALALRWRENFFRLVVVALFAFMMLQHSRFVNLFALVVPVVAAGALATRFPAMARVPSPRIRGTPWPAIAALALGAVAIPWLTEPEPSPLTTPVEALAAARAQGLQGPVYNEYDYGGYLIAQGVRTFIDGRTDQLFLGGFITRVRDAVLSPSDSAFSQLIDAHRVRWAVVKVGSDEQRHFRRMPGWREVHVDPLAAVYARR
jgi:hypothetical protein